jgi:hypothetical protein
VRADGPKNGITGSLTNGSSLCCSPNSTLGVGCIRPLCHRDGMVLLVSPFPRDRGRLLPCKLQPSSVASLKRATASFHAVAAAWVSTKRVNLAHEGAQGRSNDAHGTHIQRLETFISGQTDFQKECNQSAVPIPAVYPVGKGAISLKTASYLAESLARR